MDKDYDELTKKQAERIDKIAEKIINQIKEYLKTKLKRFNKRNFN